MRKGKVFKNWFFNNSTDKLKFFYYEINEVSIFISEIVLLSEQEEQFVHSVPLFSLDYDHPNSWGLGIQPPKPEIDATLLII